MLSDILSFVFYFFSLDGTIVLVVRVSELYLTNNDNKEILLMNNSKLINRKFMSFSDLRDNLFFSYDRKAIYEVMKRENVTYNFAKVILSNLYFLKDIDDEKIIRLKKIRSYLDSEGLLKYNFMFRNFLNSASITIYGRDYLSKEEKLILDGFDYSFQELSVYDRSLPVYEAIDINSEVDILARNVFRLIKSGVSPSKIKIINLNDEYRMIISKIFKWYNIPSNIDNGKSIFSLKMIKEFFKEETLEDGMRVLEEYVHSEKDKKIYDEVLKIVNNYVLLPWDSISKDMFRDELKSIKLNESKYSDAVEEGDLDTIYGEDYYVFIVGFNQGVLPKVFKDEDYLNDKEKELLGVSISLDCNVDFKKKLHYFISHVKNVVISYKLKSLSDIFYPSSFLDDLDVVFMKDEEDYSDSNFVNRLKLGSMLDDYYRYNVVGKDLDLLYNSYNDISYNSYDNKFTGVNLAKDNIVLSYSSVDSYNRCAFRYYLQYILKLIDFEDTFLIKLGNLFHYVLSKCFLDSFDFDTEWNSYVLDNMGELSKKERFFLVKLKSELKFIIGEISRQDRFSKLDKKFFEKEIVIPLEDNVVFKGFIDKIMYDDEGHVVVVDYKTGSVKIDLNTLPYGIGMQLPVYLYLIKNSDVFDNPIIVGFYLQELLHGEVVKNENNSYDVEKRKKLRLKGYSLGDESILSKFDSSYVDSEVISGMKVSSKGFYNYAKVLNQEEMDKILSIVNDKILETTNNVKKSNFSINPKRIGSEMVGCEFCPYGDICYHTERDVVNLKELKI